MGIKSKERCRNSTFTLGSKKSVLPSLFTYTWRCENITASPCACTRWMAYFFSFSTYYFDFSFVIVKEIHCNYIVYQTQEVTLIYVYRTSLTRIIWQSLILTLKTSFSKQNNHTSEESNQLLLDVVTRTAIIWMTDRLPAVGYIFHKSVPCANMPLTLLLPDSNFKRRCVRHNILTSSIVDVLGQEKALFVLATTLVQYMPTIWTFPFFCILIVDWLVVKTLLLLPVLSICNAFATKYNEYYQK